MASCVIVQSVEGTFVENAVITADGTAVGDGGITRCVNAVAVYAPFAIVAASAV
ncbi:hypothetical protein D3C81_2115090 [compost metagenome]